MAYLLWGLLNISLFLYFLYTCSWAIKLLREKLGLFATIIFTIGILSFALGLSNTNSSSETQIRRWKFNENNSAINNEKFSIEVALEKSIFSTCKLSIDYSKDRQSNTQFPASAYSDIEGFSSGTNWKPLSITVQNTEEKNKFSYAVNGVVEWSLFGIRLHSQKKDFTGYAVVK